MIRVLACADVHLGRCSSHLPSVLAAELTPAKAWERVVDTAVAEHVDAVTVSGDLVDEENAFYEALLPLESAAARLKNADIPLVLVAGNHDWDVVRRLAASAGDAVIVLGADGNWESRDISCADGRSLRLFGWSYPRREVYDSPLSGFPRQLLVPGMPCLGLLHAELGATGGRYCPVSRADLEAIPVDAWILGHLHRPTPVAEQGLAPAVFYAGSLQGLDPGFGEQGQHGAWLVSISAEGLAAELLPLAGVVYRDVEIDIGDLTGVGELQQELSTAIRAEAESIQVAAPACRCLVLRLSVVGRSSLGSKIIAEQLAALKAGGGLADGFDVILDDWTIRVLPPIDMEELAHDKTPLGAAVGLWRELAGVEELSPGTAAAIHRLQGELVEFSARNYALLGPWDLDSRACRRILLEQAERLVATLFAQKEGEHD